MNLPILLAQLRKQSINLDLDVFQFSPGVGGAVNTIIATVVVVILLIAGGAVSVYFFRQRRRMGEMAEEREEARLRLMRAELNLKTTDMALLSTIAGSDLPTELMPLMESRPTFEEALQRFGQNNPTAPELKQANPLRQRLEFGFGNNRNPFTNTRMLSTGVRMRCKIRLPKGEITYLTTVLGINESQFIIRPPSSKGKPVDLTRLNSLQFLVGRENDGEYEFSAPIMGQQPMGLRAVMVGHTHDISRMLFRNAERVEIDLVAQFYVIRQELASDRTAASLKALDSQYVIEGTLRDLSLGGALVVGHSNQELLHDGDMIVFRLPQAQIREDLVSMVVGIIPMDDGKVQFHLQFQGLKELNRLKLSRYLTNLKESPPSKAPPDETSAPAAS